MRNFISYIFILFGMLSCTQSSAPKAKKTSIAEKSSELTTASGKNEELSSEEDVSSSTKTPATEEEEEEEEKRGPAKVELEKTVKLVTSPIVEDPNVVFPQIRFQKTYADYVSVLRCAASYKFETLQGEIIRASNKTFTKSDKKWAWSQAMNDYRTCKIVSSYLTAEEYADIPAPSGNFYYVVNPCLNAENTDSGADECSYDLSFTQDLVDYENAFIDKMREKAIELTLAQSSLYTKLDSVRIIAKKFEIQLKRCEEFYAFKETQKALRRGLIMIGLSAVGAAAGAVIGTATPLGTANGAMMGGMLVQMMGSPIVNGLLNLNKRMNSCLYGDDENLIAQDAAQADGGSERELKRAQKSASEFESEFHVKELLDELTYLVEPISEENPLGGLISQEVTKMQEIIGEMHAIDSKVLSVNSFVAQGNRYVEAGEAYLEELPENDLDSLWASLGGI